MCVCVGGGGVPTMRFVTLLGMGLKLDMGIGDRPRDSIAYFRSDPIKGQRSSRGQVALEMPNGYQIWSNESLTRVQSIAGAKGHLGVSQGQPEVKLLRNAL